MRCTSPIRIVKGLPAGKYPDGLSVPCGRCLLCKIRRRQEWVIRLTHESELHTDKCFITLTYDDDHIPEGGSLVKKEFQDFIKRIRWKLDYHEKKELRYFACGEYGPRIMRPHYHALLFGVGCNHEHAALIRKEWDKGFVKVMPILPGGIEYVARYIDKKWLNDKEADLSSVERSFQVMSQNIGLGYVERPEVQKQLNEMMYVSKNGKKMPIPRAYVKKEVIDAAKLAAVSRDRQIDHVEKKTGISCTEDELYKSRITESTKYFRDRRDEARQSERNELAKLRINDSKL